MEKLKVTVNGNVYEVLVEVLSKDDNTYSPVAGITAVQPLPATERARPVVQQAQHIEKGKPQIVKNYNPSARSERMLYTPLPGTVLDIRVKKGEIVRTGDVLIILEAMKMENELVAEADGQVEEIFVSRGQSVQTGDKLVSFGQGS